MVTDVGMVREHNEDSGYVDPESMFFIVADGMGGHAAGEVASAMAVEYVSKSLNEHRAEIVAFANAPSEQGRRDLVQMIQDAVLAAHQAVFQRGNDEIEKHGMGTTLDVLVVAGAEAFVAHVGDSRAYLLRDGRASQITTDHTVAEVLVIEGKLTAEEAQVSPLRTILVNALGVSADVGVEMAHLQLHVGDRLLLCSDGLHDYFVTEEEVNTRLGSENGAPLPPRLEALTAMVDLAKERGGHDNITGILIDVLELPEVAKSPRGTDDTHPIDVVDPERLKTETGETHAAPDSGRTHAPSDGNPAVITRIPLDWSDDEHTEKAQTTDLKPPAPSVGVVGAKAVADAAEKTSKDPAAIKSEWEHAETLPPQAGMRAPAFVAAFKASKANAAAAPTNLDGDTIDGPALPADAATPTDDKK